MTGRAPSWRWLALLPVSLRNPQSRWRRLWLGHGFLERGAVEFPCQLEAFECFIFSLSTTTVPMPLRWPGRCCWNLCRRCDAQLSTPAFVPQSRERVPDAGLRRPDWRGSAEQTGLQRANGQLPPGQCRGPNSRSNKLAAVQRACWIRRSVGDSGRACSRRSPLWAQTTIMQRMNLLAIDVGNTRLKWSLFEAPFRARGSWRTGIGVSGTHRKAR